MTVKLYADHNVQGAVIKGLERRGVDILRAYEDGAHRAADPFLLRRAIASNRVLFTHDDDFFAEARRYQLQARAFPGILYCHQRRLTIGQLVHQLSRIALEGEPEFFANPMHVLPL